MVSQLLYRLKQTTPHHILPSYNNRCCELAKQKPPGSRTLAYQPLTGNTSGEFLSWEEKDMINFVTGGTVENTITLQLECVSCKHFFSVELLASALELPINNSHARRRTQNQAVKCPRCQADNRNWLRILHLPRYFTALRQDFPPLNSLINGILQWVDQFKAAFVALLFTGFMLVWVLYYHFDKNELVDSWALAILTFLTGIAIIFSVTGHWVKAREHRSITPYRQANGIQGNIDPHLFTGIKIFGVMVLGIPLLVHLVLPGLNYLISPLISPSVPSLESRTQGLKATALQLQEDLLAKTWTESEDKKRDEFETIISAVVTHTQALATYVNGIPEFQEATGPKPPGRPDPEILGIWIKLLGVTGIGAFLLSYQAVNGYIRRVSPLLPPPIYVSVVKLTEVAIAEIQQTLRLPQQELTEIEWLDAKRNRKGGITLSGTRIILRDTFQNPRKVRTYVVETDEWGRVQDISTKNGNGHS